MGSPLRLFTTGVCGERQWLLGRVGPADFVDVVDEEVAATALLGPQLTIFDAEGRTVFRRTAFEAVMAEKWDAARVTSLASAQPFSYGATQMVLMRLLGETLPSVLLELQQLLMIERFQLAQGCLSSTLEPEDAELLTLLQAVVPAVRDLKLLLTDCDPLGGVYATLVTQHRADPKLLFVHCALHLVNGWYALDRPYTLVSLLLMTAAALADFDPAALATVVQQAHLLVHRALHEVVQQVKDVLQAHTFRIFSQEMPYATAVEMFREQETLQSPSKAAPPANANFSLILRCGLQSGALEPIHQAVSR